MDDQAILRTILVLVQILYTIAANSTNNTSGSLKDILKTSSSSMETSFTSERKQSTNKHSCPRGFTKHRHSCYHVYTVDDSAQLNRPLAQAYCEALQSRLVDIDSDKEQYHVETLLAEKGGSAYWIGANNLKGQGKWEWEDGRPVSYNLWISDWTSWAYEVNAQACALIDTTEYFQWMFWPCKNTTYMAGKKHNNEVGIGIVCEQDLPRRKVRHAKGKRIKKRRRRRRRKLRKQMNQTQRLQE